MPIGSNKKLIIKTYFLIYFYYKECIKNDTYAVNMKF